MPASGKRDEFLSTGFRMVILYGLCISKTGAISHGFHGIMVSGNLPGSVTANVCAVPDRCLQYE